MIYKSIDLVQLNASGKISIILSFITVLSFYIFMKVYPIEVWIQYIFIPMVFGLVGILGGILLIFTMLLDRPKI